MKLISPFEAAEKRLEIQFDSKINLLRLPSHFWQQQLDYCAATILSHVRGQHVHAYLLSESSLLVFQHRIILITCGLCPLINTALALINHFSAEAVQVLSFQRQKEKYPAQQLSQFSDDAARLSQLFENLTIGKHHLHYQHALARSLAPALHWQLTPLPQHWQTQLLSSSQDKARLRQLLKLEPLQVDYLIDDWLFEPVGYSANGIARASHGQDYFCLHLSPEPSCSTLSLECSNPATLQALQKHLTRVSELDPHTT
ncbi:S-adenosylmethionine decarboxylase proenzyme [Motilimonas eburnea]|uniref:S-adenosylmethionine decarboxylase proenzyme n=1 Tax=Motilimonas eburnea TaxID=1737488 RepID=UPI001E2ECB6A|nr:S-adenosylmethionine decarboxylase proenzyme [Motilimonas eburnea]MCE2570593.1 hypothetical protein [Motilimonas eburnea]